MRSNFEKIGLEIYGESHSERIGVILSGIPSGEIIDIKDLRAFLLRRASGNNPWSTPRKEEDVAVFTRGIKLKESCAETDGGEIEAYIENKNIKQADYKDINALPRPSHADYVMYVRDGKITSGGGRFSGRMTAPLCIAGGIAKQILGRRGIKIQAYISSIGCVECGSYKDKTFEEISVLCNERNFPVLNSDAYEKAEAVISEAAAEGNSVGGTVECVVTGIRAAEFGEALFEGLEGKLAYSVFAVPAVKGIEFGGGFGLAGKTGYDANDAFVIENGEVRTETNNSGGINGGIANGMPITLRAALRPTPSVALAQKTVNLENKTEADIRIKGRHDACIVPRAVPCIESAVALALLDEALKYNAL